MSRSSRVFFGWLFSPAAGRFIFFDRPLVSAGVERPGAHRPGRCGCQAVTAWWRGGYPGEARQYPGEDSQCEIVGRRHGVAEPLAGKRQQKQAGVRMPFGGLPPAAVSAVTHGCGGAKRSHGKLVGRGSGPPGTAVGGRLDGAAGAWEGVVELLAPNRVVLLTPRSLNLYAAAMHELGRETELAVEMGRHNSRWPEPLVLYWTAQEALGGHQRSALPMVEGSLVRAGRPCQGLNPAWVFDFARTSFENGLKDDAKSWIVQVKGSELPPRYLLFYFALIERLGMQEFLVGPMEPRLGEGAAFLTYEEAAWLRENESR